MVVVNVCRRTSDRFVDYLLAHVFAAHHADTQLKWICAWTTNNQNDMLDSLTEPSWLNVLELILQSEAHKKDTLAALWPLMMRILASPTNAGENP